MKQVKVFIDGASRGNPGPAAIGAVFQHADGKVFKELSFRIGTATNNVAEYTALIFALQEALMLRIEELRVFTDSELLAKQYSGEYKIKNSDLRVLSLQVNHLKKGFKTISVTHVPRGDNKLADAQANKALDRDLSIFLQAG